MFNADHAEQAAFEGWGDLAAANSCGKPQVIATGTGDAGPDSAALFELANRAPSRVSEPAEFPGPVTALWPAPGGAVAVVRLPSNKYAAFSLTVDCGR